MAKIKLIGSKVLEKEVLTSSVIGYHVLVDGLVVLLKKVSHKEHEYVLRK